MFVKLLTLAAILLCAVPVLAQPAITNISPTGSPAVAGYGGAGPHSVELTITGSGFSVTPKATRFVGVNDDDILFGVSCSSTTTCTAAGSRPNRVAPGSVQTLAVFAMVNGVKSAGSANFLYYGGLIITGLVPGTGAFDVSTPANVIGGPFTSGASFRGTSSVYIYTFIADYTNGCASTGQCAFTARSLEEDLSASQGAYTVAVGTPGGIGHDLFPVRHDACDADHHVHQPAQWSRRRREHPHDHRYRVQTNADCDDVVHNLSSWHRHLQYCDRELYERHDVHGDRPGRRPRRSGGCSGVYQLSCGHGVRGHA